VYSSLSRESAIRVTAREFLVLEDGKPPESPKPSPPVATSTWIGVAVGALAGWYAGLHLLIPLGFAALAARALSKRVAVENRPMVPASAILAGHGLWMSLGVIYLAQFNLSVLDLVILIGGALWLAFGPSKLAVGLLIAYEIVGLAVNVPAFFAEAAGTNIHKALFAHIILRVAAIVLMVYGLIVIGRQKMQRQIEPT
jgi:hypothetical protein